MRRPVALVTAAKAVAIRSHLEERRRGASIRAFVGRV